MTLDPLLLFAAVNLSGSSAGISISGVHPQAWCSSALSPR